MAAFQQKKVYFPFQVLIFNARSLSFYIELACLACSVCATEKKYIFLHKKNTRPPILADTLRHTGSIPLVCMHAASMVTLVGLVPLMCLQYSYLSICFKLADAIEAKTLIVAQASERHQLFNISLKTTLVHRNWSKLAVRARMSVARCIIALTFLARNQVALQFMGALGIGPLFGRDNGVIWCGTKRHWPRSAA
jgi:hypothetical protein